MFAVVEIPIVAYLINAQRTGELVDGLSAWGHRHSRTIAIVVATASGLWLLIRGITDLAK
jgi:hypothetical protein